MDDEYEARAEAEHWQRLFDGQEQTIADAQREIARLKNRPPPTQRRQSLLLTGGGDWERYTFRGACNEPVPNNWKNACRRRAGHSGPHHTWDPRTGTNRGRHPYPVYDDAGRKWETVDVWPTPLFHTTRMLRGHGAYIAPATTDRLIVAATKARERPTE